MGDTLRTLALSGLAYEDFAPLGWRSLPALPQGTDLARLNAENVQVLLATASVEEHRTLEHKDDSQPLHQELQRLEFKVDVVLRLLTTMLQQQRGLPPSRRFRIAAQGLEWMEPETKITAPAFGIVSLYVNSALPFPVELPGQVMSVTRVNNETTVRVEFRELSPQVRELIEKLIFRHHRRLVAESRQARDGATSQ